MCNVLELRTKLLSSHMLFVLCHIEGSLPWSKDECYNGDSSYTIKVYASCVTLMQRLSQNGR